MADSDQLLAVLEGFAATMANTFEIDDVLHELGDSTVTVLGAAGAGVSVADADGRLSFVTATSESVVEIERSQERNQAGPCVKAFTTGDPVVVDDIAALDDWPDYRRTAARSGIVSVIGLPLVVGERRIGSLDVYDIRVRNWTQDDLRIARVLADIATTYILRAGELAQARTTTEQLQRALDSRVTIEQAKGMLARDHDVTVAEAFELLRSHSRRHNIALRTVADAVVNLGLQLPGGPAGPTVSQ